MSVKLHNLHYGVEDRRKIDPAFPSSTAPPLNACNRLYRFACSSSSRVNQRRQSSRKVAQYRTVLNSARGAAVEGTMKSKNIGLFLASFLTASCAVSPPPQPQTESPATSVEASTPKSLEQSLAQAVELLKADDTAGGTRELNRVVNSMLFPLLSEAQQHIALFLSGVVAYDAKDHKEAHRLLLLSSSMSEADGNDWWYRFLSADRTDLKENARCLMQLASNWPERLADVNDVFVMRIVGKMQEDGSLAAARWELIDALSKSQWKLQFGEPSKLWKDLVLHLLENGEPTRASEVALRVTAPSILIGMRADRRFEKVIASNPAHFDIAKATESNIAALRASVAEHPRSLEALMELTYALLTTLRYDEVLQLTTVAIERAQAAPKDTGPFDDIDSYLNWVMDNRGLALRGLGRWDEAIRQRIVAAATLENGHVNVSHAINLAQTYADTARAADALATLAKVGDDLSPYGRMQVEIVKLSVAAQMHDNAEITRVMDYVALHRKDSEETYQIALVVANRLDEAAQVLIARLEDPDLRFDALQEVQTYREARTTLFQEQIRIRKRSMLNRSDVRKAIARVGVAEKYDIDPI